jgi:glycosyltransferase involved in cell wall biosynthesis
MRLLHLLHQYLPEQVGGTELYTQWLAETLHDRGHDVSIFFRRSSEMAVAPAQPQSGPRLWPAWSGPLTPTGRFLTTFGRRSLVEAFDRVLVQTQPELVHIQHLMGQPAALIRCIRQRNIPYVITLHDYWWVCANAQLLTNYSQELCGGPHFYLNCARCSLARAGYRQNRWVLPLLAGPLAWRNFLLGRALHSAERLIAPTEFVRRWYVKWGVPADKVLTIPHGLPLSGLAATAPAPAASLPFRLAYIGGLSFQKGVHRLIEAVAGLSGEVELWLAGDETTDPAYVARLRAAAPPQTRFWGKLSRAQVWDLLTQVAVVVVPSLWYETFTFVISEAFAAGVPVVASRLGPLADRVRHGVDGLLVAPDDPLALRAALQQLLDDPALLARLRRGIAPVEDIESHTSKIEALYQQILAR